MAGRPHAGQLRPGVPTAQLHQPPRWFQVSDYPPLLYLARIEHSPAQRTAPDVIHCPRSQPPPLLSSPFALSELHSKGKAKLRPAQLQLQLQLPLQRSCSLIACGPYRASSYSACYFSSSFVSFSFVALFPCLCPLGWRALPAMQSWVHSSLSLLPPKWAAGLDQVRPDLSSARRPLGSEQLHAV